MTRIWIVGVAMSSLVACGNKLDCDKYVSRIDKIATFGETSDAMVKRRAAVNAVTRAQCDGGEITPTMVDCVQGMSSVPELRMCFTGKPFDAILEATNTGSP